MVLDAQSINTNTGSKDLNESNECNPEQLNLALESKEILETRHHINSCHSNVLDWNIVWDSCPSCQSEVWVTGFCVKCGYSMNNNYNNDFEKQLPKNELLDHINTLDWVFEDVDLTSIHCDVIEVSWKSRDRTQFVSKWITFEILSLWSSAAYFAEGKQFTLSDIPQKSYVFWLMRTRINLSIKWKFKQRDILEEAWEDASYMKELSHWSYRNLPECKWKQYRWKFIHIEWKIQESQAELHFMLWWKQYRVTINYSIWPNSNHDPDSWLVASGLSILKYQILKWNKWLDEWRLKRDQKEILKNLSFEILNNYNYNPYIVTD